jgi:hypothetical protein
MPGGPSQMDTFDLKPGHANGGPFQEIATSVPGLKISEHLPKLAAQAERLAIIRSLSTAEGDHNRGTYLMHTGHKPGGPISFPTMGSTLSKALGANDAELPNFISIAPQTALNSAAFGPGFLGPRHGPLTVGAGAGPLIQPQQGAADLGGRLAQPERDPPAGRRPAGPVADPAGRLSGVARLGVAAGAEHRL